MNDYPHKCESAAQICAGKIQQYLEACASRERWPDGMEVDSIIANHFAPILRKSTPKQPIDGTLLAAFTRFADLSCYWHRNGTPDSLALSELQERNRLATDLPELIKRLTAFASLNTEPRFEAEARVIAEPPKENQGATSPATEYRMLEPGEIIQEGDQSGYAEPKEPYWDTCAKTSIGLEAGWSPSFRYRRKVVSNDTAGQGKEMEGKRDHEAASGQSEASEDGWRILEVGEYIEEDDEVLGRHKWHPVTNMAIGVPVQPGFFSHFRRRIPAKHPESDRAALGIANLIEHDQGGGK